MNLIYITSEELSFILELHKVVTTIHSFDQKNNGIASTMSLLNKLNIPESKKTDLVEKTKVSKAILNSKNTKMPTFYSMKNKILPNHTTDKNP